MMANSSHDHQWLLRTVLFLLLPLLLPLFFLLLKIQKKRSQSSLSNLPPSPPKLPILGNLHQLGNFPHRSLHQLSLKHGPVMLLQLGSIPTVVISSAEMAKEVMRTHDLDCCTRPQSPGSKILSYNYLDIVFSPYGDYWKEIRKLFVTELLTMKRVQSFEYAREAELDKLLSALGRQSGNPVKLDDKIFALTDGLIGTVAFGKICGTDKFKNLSLQELLNEVMILLGSFSAEDFFPSTGGFVDKLTGLSARREKIFGDLDGFFQMVIEQHLDPARVRLKPEEEDIVDVLIRLWKNQTGYVSWCNAFYCGHDNMDNVRANEEAADDEQVTMVVKETLRLHPPLAMLLPRETMRHCEIGGYDVYPQTRLYVNSWAIGRDPRSWENPEEFYPERFQDSDVNFRGSHFELVPFGAGRRICPGLDMGSMNVEYTLANLLYRFDWDLPGGMRREDMNMEEVGGLIINKKTPLYLVPISHHFHGD